MKIIMKEDKSSFFFKVFLLSVFFLYVYNILFLGLPAGFGTRQIFGFIGLGWFLKNQLNIYFLNGNIYIKKNILMLLVLIASVGGMALLTNLINNTDEKVFLRYPISFISVIFSSYFLLKLFKYVYKENLSYLVISRYFINVVLIQVLIAASMFFIPSIADFFNSIQNVSDFNEERLQMLGELRIIGFGSLFFASGVVNGFGLMLIPIVLKTSNKKGVIVFYYALVFLIIFAIGMMMARTTIIGAAISFVLLLLPTSFNKLTFSKIIFKFIKNVILVPFLFVIIILSLSDELKDKITTLSNFGFEMFINYIDGKGLSSSSQDELKDMYIWPKTLKTYFIGDGYFVDPDDSDSYYMGSDVGYIRMIYYFGVVGLFFFLLTTIYPLMIVYRESENRTFKNLFFFSIIYFLILNFKGFTDIFFIFILFGLLAILNKKKLC
jgi:hypothetical protein